MWTCIGFYAMQVHISFLKVFNTLNQKLKILQL